MVVAGLMHRKRDSQVDLTRTGRWGRVKLHGAKLTLNSCELEESCYFVGVADSRTRSCFRSVPGTPRRHALSWRAQGVKGSPLPASSAE